MNAMIGLGITAVILILLVITSKHEDMVIGQVASENTPKIPHQNKPSTRLDTTMSGRGLSPDSNWQRLRQKVLLRDNYKCVICGSSERPTVDHIKELSLGGNNALINLRTLCASCHQKRHKRDFLNRAFDADDNYGENSKLSPKRAAVIGAIKAGNSLGIKYVDRDGLQSERVIHPKRIFKTKYVYVDAYCELDKANRVFRLSRMQPSNSTRNFYANATNSYTSRPWGGDSQWDHDRK